MQAFLGRDAALRMSVIYLAEFHLRPPCVGVQVSTGCLYRGPGVFSARAKVPFKGYKSPSQHSYA